MNLIDANSYSLSLNSLDDKEEESFLKPAIVVTVTNGMVILKVSLPYRRLWNYTVLVYDCEDYPLMEEKELISNLITLQYHTCCSS